MGGAGLEQHVAAILNAAWWVRHHARGGRLKSMELQRTQAISLLGLTVRSAFNESDNFEPLLIALVDGLSKGNDPPF